MGAQIKVILAAVAVTLITLIAIQADANEGDIQQPCSHIRSLFARDPIFGRVHKLQCRECCRDQHNFKFSFFTHGELKSCRCANLFRQLAFGSPEELENDEDDDSDDDE